MTGSHPKRILFLMENETFGFLWALKDMGDFIVVFIFPKEKKTPSILKTKLIFISSILKMFE